VNLLDYLYAVIPMLGVLIFIHELGHFLVAKACGVRVLKFSLGFGAPVGFGRFRLRWVRGGTEYLVAWFPLGGFVKMLGENLLVQGEDDPDAVTDASPGEYLNAKPTWQKLAIVFAGPVMNLLLPVVAFVGVLLVGVPRPAPVIGTVEFGSPAAEAGLQTGDRLLAVDGVEVSWWEDLAPMIRDRSRGSVALQVEREGREFSVSVPVVARAGLDEFETVKKVGWIGVHNWRLPALVGVPSGDAPAAAAGLRSGDLVASLDGGAVEDWSSLERRYRRADGAAVELEVVRGTTGETETVSVPAMGELESLGVVPATVLVESVDEQLPAGRAGLRTGDLILTVDGRPVGSFSTFQETVRASEGRSLTLTFARDGVTHTVSMSPEKSQIEGSLGTEERVLIGIRHRPTPLPGIQEILRERNPLRAVPLALTMTVDITTRFLQVFGKILTGEIGRDKLAGPIGIAQIARESLNLGWQAYLYTMILISINLGILNLLPIPILDGGQALLFGVEGIKRAPISLRTREIVQHLGLTMILMLMGLAF
jgi:regulator of sigma E protease